MIDYTYQEGVPSNMSILFKSQWDCLVVNIVFLLRSAFGVYLISFHEGVILIRERYLTKVGAYFKEGEVILIKFQ